MVNLWNRFLEWNRLRRVNHWRNWIATGNSRLRKSHESPTTEYYEQEREVINFITGEREWGPMYGRGSNRCYRLVDKVTGDIIVEEIR